MAIKGEQETVVGSNYERTRSFSVLWPYGNPLPTIYVTREKLIVDDAMAVVSRVGDESRPINAEVIAGKTYTAAGVTASGAQIIALVTKILDTECADFFA